jgi:arsenate reductase
MWARGIRGSFLAKNKILFLCIGNSCRSQMAEGFARTYGSDVMEAVSAGLGPAMSVSPMTIDAMKEKNIDMSDAVPKGVDDVDRSGLSLIVNISGQKLPVRGISLVDWDVRDPIGRDEKVFREVRDEIERRVMQLILQFRAEENPPEKFDTQGRRFR